MRMATLISIYVYIYIYILESEIVHRKIIGRGQHLVRTKRHCGDQVRE